MKEDDFLAQIVSNFLRQLDRLEDTTRGFLNDLLAVLSRQILFTSHFHTLLE